MEPKEMITRLIDAPWGVMLHGISSFFFSKKEKEKED